MATRRSSLPDSKLASFIVAEDFAHQKSTHASRLAHAKIQEQPNTNQNLCTFLKP
jgi:hypothetical protein